MIFKRVLIQYGEIMKTIDKSRIDIENYSYLSLFDEQFSILDFKNTVKNVEKSSGKHIDLAKIDFQYALER